MSAEKYCIFRTEKIKSLSGLQQRAAHDDRSHTVENADQKMSGKNRVIGAKASEIVAAWKTRLGSNGGRKVATNAVHAIELFLGHSPGAVIDETRYANDCLAWARKAFGGSENILQGSYHRDERTPHVHVLLIPINSETGRLNAKHYLGGSHKLRRLQDSFAQEVGHNHGLIRGQTGSSSQHIPAKILRKISGKNLEEIRNQPQEVKDAALALAHTAAEKAKADQKNADRKRVAADDRRKQAEAEAKTLADRLREIDLRCVMDALGYQVKKSAGEETIYEAEDGFISIRDNMYSCDWATGGRGAISLVMTLRKCVFREAIAELKSIDLDAGVSSAVTHIERQAKTVPPLSTEDKIAKYADQCPEKWPQARDYLVNTRGISSSLVDLLHTNGDVWANSKGSVCFAHRDQTGQIRGATIRGTDPVRRFIQAIGDKISAFFRTPGSGRNWIVESPIDALSVTTLFGNPATSVGGCNIPEQLLDTSKPPVVALDGDEAGEKGARLAIRKNSRALRVPPPKNSKDWNEALAKKLDKILALGSGSQATKENNKPKEKHAPSTTLRRWVRKIPTWASSHWNYLSTRRHHGMAVPQRRGHHPAQRP